VHHLRYEYLSPEPTPSPGSMSRTFWYVGCPRFDSATVSGETWRGKWVATTRIKSRGFRPPVKCAMRTGRCGDWRATRRQPCTREAGSAPCVNQTVAMRRPRQQAPVMSRSSAPWQALNERIAGDVILPDSPGYDTARKPALARFDHVRPEAIVRCRTPIDVAMTLELARAARAYRSHREAAGTASRADPPPLGWSSTSRP
jgi:hypothetical protein